jgi:hypothetical protein
MKPGNMKNFKRVLILLALAGITVFTGCEKTEDDSDISTADREKFLGQWNGVSSGSGGTRNFNMTITGSNSAPDQILMENFDLAGSGTYVRAIVSGNSLTILTTTISGETYDGTGVLSNDGKRLTFNFSIDDGQTLENRTATTDKQ